MKRTTIRLSDDLLRAARLRARETGRTLTQLVEHALRAELHGQPAALRLWTPLPTFRGEGTRVAIDLSSGVALQDAMEDHSALHPNA